MSPAQRRRHLPLRERVTELGRAAQALHGRRPKEELARGDRHRRPPLLGCRCVSLAVRLRTVQRVLVPVFIDHQSGARKALQ